MPTPYANNFAEPASWNEPPDLDPAALADAASLFGDAEGTAAQQRTAIF
jgi:hypothetical protein